MLFTVITGPSYEKAHASLRSALKRGVDGVELRIDTFSQLDWEALRSLRKDAASLRVLMTLRSVSQGGAYQGEETERLALIDQLCTLHPDLLDLEWDVPPSFRSKLLKEYPHIKLVTSYHNFSETPADLSALLDSLRSEFAHVVKIATFAQTTGDALRMIELVRSRSSSMHLIGICMGDEGLLTRILGPVMGNYLDYTFIDPTDQTAPGQIALDLLEKRYHYRSLNKETALFALIGSPVHRSLGPVLHNAVFGELKMNAVYLSISVVPTQLGSTLLLLRKLPFKGLSVTMPLKEAIIPFLDQLTPQAKRIGAVNTVEVVNGRWIGHNTDGIGALRAIEKKIPVEGRRLIVIGAGGAAKAIVYEALRKKAEVVVINRTAIKAEMLAQEHHCRGGGLDLLAHLYREGYEIIVNCTPEAEPVPFELLFPHCHAMDLAYNPHLTPFLAQAARRPCQLIYGIDMFIEQAIEQQLIWFPLNEKKRMEDIVRNLEEVK